MLVACTFADTRSLADWMVEGMFNNSLTQCNLDEIQNRLVEHSI